MENYLQEYVRIGSFVPEEEDLAALMDLVHNALYKECNNSRQTIASSFHDGSFMPTHLHSADGHLFMDLTHEEFGRVPVYLGEVSHEFRRMAPANRTIRLQD